MAIRERKTADVRREEIEEAALRLIDRFGPDRMTTEQIAREVGISQPAVFRHFPTKDALYEAVLRRIEARAQAGWNTADSETHTAGGDPLDRLRALIGAQLRLIRSTPAMPQLLFSRVIQAQTSLPRTVLSGIMRGYIGRLEARVADAQAADFLRRDVAAADAALLLVGLIQGLVLRWTVMGREFDLVEEGMRLLDIQLRCLDGMEGRG